MASDVTDVKEDYSLSSIESVSSNEDHFVQKGISDNINKSQLAEKSAGGKDKESVASKREKRRNKIIQEILDTEESYHRHLNLVTEFLEEPLKKLKLIPDHVVVTIFSNIKQIIKINEELKKNLLILPVGKAFLQIGPFLKLYSTYANNHERALATLMEWDQKRPEFSNFRRHQEGREEFAGLKLNALLITPVQRVPRYKLLLEDLLAYTDQKHEDYASLKEACAQISAVAMHINEHIKQQDNFMKMLAIQKSLAGQLAPKILTPGRMFIKDGPLKKVSKNGGRSHERMFFLFSDILLYGKPKLLESVSSHTYSCCCILPLQHCSVSRVFGHSQGQASLFTVQCKDESLLLYSDQKTVESWLKALTSAISKFVENRQSLRKESSAKMPVRKGGLVKYMKQQEKADPLKTGKKTQDSPVNKTTPKTPKFLKRTLKDKEPNSSPSTPSPRKRQLQEALMKARENVWCLSPRKSGRKKRRGENSDGEEQLQDSECVSSPQLKQRLDNSHLEIGLDPSHIWKEGEDSTILEPSSVIIANDINQSPVEDVVDSHTSESNPNSRVDCDTGKHETQDINIKLPIESNTKHREVNPVFYEVGYSRSQSLENFSRISLDREKMRCSELSADGGTSVFSVDSPYCYRKQGTHIMTDEVDSKPEGVEEAATAYTGSSNFYALLRKKPTPHKEVRPDSCSSSSEADGRERMSMQECTGVSSPQCRLSQSSSNVSDTSRSSFNTSLGELNEESLQSLTRHYSLLLDASEEPKQWKRNRRKEQGNNTTKKKGQDLSSSDVGSRGGSCKVQYVARDSSHYQRLEEYLSPIRQVHSVQSQGTTVQSMPFSSSPICSGQHSKDNLTCDAATISDTKVRPSCVKKDKKSKLKKSGGFKREDCEKCDPTACNLTENVVPLRGWTTCYTRLKMLPGVQEESDSELDETGADSEEEEEKEEVEKNATENHIGEESKENLLRWDDALEGMSQAGKAIYNTTPYPVTGAGCVLQ